MSLLIKKDNRYFDLSVGSYDTANLCYVGEELASTDAILAKLASSTLSTEYLSTEITIGGETFKPISKINNFSIISSTNYNLAVHGTKNKSELLIQKEFISSSTNDFIANISGFKINSLDQEVKIVFSYDGRTWNTIINSAITSLNTTTSLIPTEDEKLALKEEIGTKGISNIGTNTYNISYSPSQIKFAYLLNENSKLENLNVIYKEQNHLAQLTKNEYSLNWYDELLSIVPCDNNERYIINILTNEKRTLVDDTKEKLPEPVVVATATDNMINISWDSIPNADTYQVYINNVLISSVKELSYNYTMTTKSYYAISVKAISSSVKYSNSLFSEVVYIDRQGYLSQSDNIYVGVSLNGNIAKLKVNDSMD